MSGNSLSDYQWLFTSISLGLPIPCGLFTPVFIMGAAFGRFVGEVARYIVTDVWQGPAIIAGGYAVVGAAGLSAGVTRTLSTAVIVFELTGQLQYFMPVLVRATRSPEEVRAYSYQSRSHTHTHTHHRLPFSLAQESETSSPDRHTMHCSSRSVCLICLRLAT